RRRRSLCAARRQRGRARSHRLGPARRRERVRAAAALREPGALARLVRRLGATRPPLRAAGGRRAGTTRRGARRWRLERTTHRGVEVRDLRGRARGARGLLGGAGRRIAAFDRALRGARPRPLSPALRPTATPRRGNRAVVILPAP